MNETVTEPLVVDYEPQPGIRPPTPVVLTIETPPKGTSHGWGDMSWTRHN